MMSHRKHTLLLFLTLMSFGNSLWGQSFLYGDCVNALPVGSAGGGFPIVDLGCINETPGACFGSAEDQSLWLTFNCTASGTFEFSATPFGLGADYDYTLYAGGCPTSGGVEIACDWRGPVFTPGPFFPTGIATNPLTSFGTTSIEFQPTINITAGVRYYLLLNNITANNVGVNVVFGGTAQIAAPASTPHPPPSNIIGATSACVGGTKTYSITPSPLYNSYIWTVNGAIINGTSTGPSIQVNFNAPGVAQICVQGVVGCYTTTPYCINVPVTQIVAPPFSASVCLNGSYLAPNGQTYNTPGTYSMHFTSYQGCDSTVMLILSPKPFPAPTNITATVCPGECYLVGTTAVCSTGLTTIRLQSWLGCDSVVNLTLNNTVLVPIISPPQTITCGRPQVSLNGSASQGTITQYRWRKSSGISAGTGPIVNVNTPGVYILQISGPGPNGTTCRVESSVAVTIDTAAFALSHPIQDTLPCSGSINLRANTNAVNAMYAWSGPNMFSSTSATPTVQQVGSYSVVVTDNRGCTKSDTLIVYGNNQGPVLTLTSDTIQCQSNGAAVSAIANPSSPTIFWIHPNGDTIPSANFTATEPGTYQVIAQNGVNCTTHETLEIYGDVSNPIVRITTDSLDCVSMGLIEASTLSTGNTFAWTGPSFTSIDSTILVGTVGAYQVIVTAPNGCSTTRTVSMFADTLKPIVSTANDTLYCSTPSVQLNLSVNGTYADVQWLGPGFSSAIPEPIINTPGNYEVTVTGTNGCATLAQAIIYQDADFPMVQLIADTLTCLKTSSDIETTVTGTGLTFDWTGPQGYTSSIKDIVVTLPGMYEVAVEASNGCRTLSSITVYADTLAPQNLVANNGLIDCNQPTAMLSVSSTTPGTTFSWLSPNMTTTNTAQISASEVGSYLITATAPNGCIDTTSAFLQQDASLPTLRLVTDTLTCFQPQGQIRAITNVTNGNWNWTGPSFNSNLLAPTVSQSGTYQFTVTADNNCTASGSIQVRIDTIAPRAFTILEDTINCLQSTAQIGILNGNNAWMHFWKGPEIVNSNTASITISTAGIYTDSIIGRNGCYTLQQIQVQADTIRPFINLIADTINCTFTTAIIQSNSSPNVQSYEWTGPLGFTSLDTNAVVSQEGLYSLMVTSENGCSSSETIMVMADLQTPVISIFGDSLTCARSFTNLEAQSNLANTNFSWTSPTNVAYNGSIWSNQSTPGTYILKATSPNGCLNIDSITIYESIALPQIQIQTSSTTLDCNNNSIILSVTGDPIDTIHWEQGTLFNSSTTWTTNSEGWVYVEGVAANGCQNRDSVFIDDQRDLPIVQIQTDTITCLQNEVPLTGWTNATNAITQWTGPNGFSSNDIESITDQSGWYYLNITNLQGCTAVDSIEVYESRNFPQITISTPDSIRCTNPSIVLSGLGSSLGMDFVYTWTTEQGEIESGANALNPEISAAGIYTLSILNSSNGCVTIDSIEVFGNKNLQANPTIEILSPLCAHEENGSISISNVAGGVAPYTYDLSGIIQNQGLFVNLVSSNYSLSITDSNGCTWQDNVYVAPTQVNAVQLTLETLWAETLIPLGTSVSIDLQYSLSNQQIANTHVTFNGSSIACDLCTELSFTPLENGLLEVIVTDKNGCQAVDKIDIFVNAEVPIYIPNAFSPNNDNNNDFFLPYIYTGVTKVEKMIIADRWGGLVYQSTDHETIITLGWDGNHKNEKAQLGVYVYYFEVLLLDGSKKIIKGEVNLVR